MPSPSRSTSTLRNLSNTFLVLLAGTCAACGRQDRSAPPTADGDSASAPSRARGKADRTTKEYRLAGVVRGVDRETGQVRIHHDEIPGFMPAMTMPFSIKDQNVISKLKVGNAVEGTLRVEEEDGAVSDYELIDLAVVATMSEAESTPGQELTVGLVGGEPTLTIKPKTLDVGEVVPDFSMTDQDGKSLKLSDLRGDVVALTFIYTRCPLPDFCPMMDRKFSELSRRISLSPSRSGKIRLISLSFDPEHDVPDVLKKHAALRGATPPLWTYAVASHDELAKIAPKLGLIYGPGRDEIMHNLCTAVIDAQGKLARLDVGTSRNKWNPDDVLKTIDGLLPPRND